MSKKKRRQAPPEESIGDYYSKLSVEEKKFIRRFDKDLYVGGVHEDESVLETDEAVKEATKNHNSLRRDAFDVARNTGFLEDISKTDREFMDDASDEWEWRDEYKKDGYRAAVNLILAQTLQDLDNKYVDRKITLTRFYEKLNRLNRTYKTDRNKKRQK